MAIFEYLLHGLKLVASFTFRFRNENNSSNISTPQAAMGINNQQHITNNFGPIDKKSEDRSLFEAAIDAAIEDVKHNGSYVGKPGVPFQINAIRNLLSYGGAHSLDENDKEKLRKYVHDAVICNGGALRTGVSPGAVQGKQASLILMLENYKSKASQ